jgi:hypothetical protein
MFVRTEYEVAIKTKERLHVSPMSRAMFSEQFHPVHLSETNG